MSSILDKDIKDMMKNNQPLVSKVKDRTFFITGASGMIGRYVAHFLLNAIKEGDGVGRVILNSRSESKLNTIFSDFVDSDILHKNIGDVSDITSIPRGVDVVIHLASPTQPEDFQNNPVGIIDANVIATRNLLDATRNADASFCLLSTLEVYGEVNSSNYPVVVDESTYGALDSTSLRSVYPESKRLAESMCISYQEQYGTESTIIRLSPTVSPIVDPTDNRIFAQFINSALNNEDLSIYSDAVSKERSYTYVADVATGILTAIFASGVENRVFNLSNNNNVTTLGDLAKKIIDVSERDVSLNILEREGDTNTSTSTGMIILDSSKLLGCNWKPVYSLEKSILYTLESLSNR